jgi:hypothetical protein
MMNLFAQFLSYDFLEKNKSNHFLHIVKKNVKK